MRGFDCTALRRRQTFESFESNFRSLFGEMSLDNVLSAGTSEPFRDGWIALHFAQATSANEVWLTPKGDHDDFFVPRDNSLPVRFQATEALAPGRRRGDERKHRKNEPHEITQEEMESEERVAGSVLISACERKLRAGNKRLVIYWNFAIFRLPGFDGEVAAGLRALIGPLFEELWLIRDSSLIKVQSNYWAGQ